MLKCWCVTQKQTFRPSQLDNEFPVMRKRTIPSTPVLIKMRESDGQVVNDLEHRRSAVRAISINFDTNAEPLKYPKNSIDKEVIKNAIQENEFLSKIIIGDRLQLIVDAMHRRDVDANEVIIEENDFGAHMYVSADGTYEVSVKGKVINIFNDKRVFGELAILYDAQRNATIKSTEMGRLWVLDQAIFKQIMLLGNINEQEEMCSFLKNVPQLNTVGEERLHQVAKLLSTERFNADTIIIRQGDRGDKFYIIRDGTVTISKQNVGVVNTYTRGQFFGDLALLTENRRQATVTANAPGVECFTLDQKHFIKYFGNMDLKQIHISHNAQAEDTQKNESKYGDIRLSDLQPKKVLGEGAFGRVLLMVNKKNKNAIFALKYIKKVDMIRRQHVKYIFQEKQIQKSCNCMFMVQLYQTYQDSKYLYFLMEACLGGDLFSLLHKQPTRYFQEPAALFIAACVLEALAYLHQKNIIYRDLKPENILLDEQGYIKLADFGSAKLLDAHSKTYTYIGTPEYLAPEIVLERGYDKAIDCWAFGIFVFELLVGRTPFANRQGNRIEILSSILKGFDNVRFPTHVGQTAENLIRNLCRIVPIERLGYTKSGMQDVRKHRWFTGFDFSRLQERKLKAPFPPRLRNNIDTRHFYDIPKDTDIPEDDTTDYFKNF